MRRILNGGAALGLGLTLLAAGGAGAQEATARADAVAVVDGVVREVFRSPRQGRVDVLVQVEVRRSEAGKPPRLGGRVTCPAPGDSIYVHLTQPADGAGRASTGPAIPAELSQIRAYLAPRALGGWEGTVPDWFEVTSDRTIARGPSEAAPAPERPGAPPTTTTTTTSTTPPPTTAPAPANPPGKAALDTLGVTADPLTVKGQTVLRITAVERGGLAQKAGIEVGDVIAGVDGNPLTGPDQLDALCRRGVPMILIVVDVNSGKAAQVEIKPPAATTTANAGPAPGQPRTPEPTPPTPPAPSRSLGIAAEPISLGGRTALKITRIEPDSPAARAGLELGDVLVSANGVAVTGPEQLAAALRKGGPVLSLQVRDVRTGRDTPVEVTLGGPPKVEIPAIPGDRPPTPPGAPTDRLGAVTELSFYDVEAAVKITEVEAGGPAARAGLQAGTIVLAADGKPVLHPTELIEAARKATSSIRLTVVDARTGRKSDVDVDLRGR